MNTPKDELTALLALTKIEGLGPTGAKLLYKQIGNAKDIFRNHKDLKNIIPGVNPRLIEALDDSGSFVLAENEIKFLEANNIRCLTPDDDKYPKRLFDCNDAPLVLYMMGNANLNATKTVSIVGTRKATEYGLHLCNSFIKELKMACPDVLIISGLAYGIDIEAHKSCLECNCSTVGVLAHGLDKIYPSAHRRIAKEMLETGGVLTEYMSGTTPFATNFVRRNRIIAGLSDAVIVVESAAHGGSLITAEMADGYNRECFAFPGCVGDPYSEGCNALIKDNKAALICGTQDFIDAMRWSPSLNNNNRSQAIQTSLFNELSVEEEKVLNRLRQKANGVPVNALIVDCNICYSRITSILFELEMKGLVKRTVGGLYKATTT